jgi:hypothetical protein
MVKVISRFEKGLYKPIEKFSTESFGKLKMRKLVLWFETWLMET